MVIDRGQRSAKKPIKQGVGEDTPEPIKIGASTPYDFDSKNLTAYGGLLPVATMLEKLQISAVGRRNPHREARDASDALVSIRAEHGAGSVCGIFSTASSAISGTRADVNRDIEGVAFAAAVHFLAFSGLLAWKCRAANTGSSPTDATARVGSRAY